MMLRGNRFGFDKDINVSDLHKPPWGNLPVRAKRPEVGANDPPGYPCRVSVPHGQKALEWPVARGIA
jgi:hypothetical protein